ncbi:autotransporter domain-containing protein [Xenorhabdus innexi]|uniref:Lipase 1 n=1 Tax=Xenorhabdus innexi TaxID=290109 RepID=A0A1N6MWX3_9GAMM|nr:autotransporter domain-containing protein [Xenorhabdus innexi]PHM33544.1 outer membrane esterase [Xenorhabdus innexi]SIP73378.1 Lipase 1 [Xenorhabdus innexi]
MKKAFLFAPALLALSISTVANALSYNDFCVFGDSLSDEEFTTEKNSSYKYDVAKKLTGKESKDHDPNNPKRDCINVPKGGATAIPIKMFTEGSGHKNPNESTTQEQLEAYLAQHNHRFSPNKIYVHWIGGNDIKFALYNALKIQKTSQISPFRSPEITRKRNAETIGNQNIPKVSIYRNPELILKESAEAAGNQIRYIADNGAGLVIAPNVPDLGTTPRLLEEILREGIKPALTAISAPKLTKEFMEQGVAPDQIKQHINDAIDTAIKGILHKIHTDINKAIIPSGEGRELALKSVFDGVRKEAESMILKEAENQVKNRIKDLPKEKADEIVKQIAEEIMQTMATEYGISPKEMGEKLAEGYAKASAIATKYTEEYNNQVENIINQSNGNILRADIYGLLHEVIANPLSYGFDNNLGYGCGFSIGADKCNIGQESFDRSKQFIFSDNFHASTLAQELISQYIESIYIAPSQVMTLNQVNRVPVKGTRASLDGHLQQLRSNGNEQGKFGVFGGYTNNRQDSFNLGGDYQLAEGFLLGALYSNNKFDRSPVSDFTYEGNGHVAAGYALWNVFDNAWLSGDIHYARTNYDSLIRSIQLGKATRKEIGSTTGKQWGARITANWDIPVIDMVTTSPIVQFSWDKGDVKGYRESGDNSSAMHFSDQSYTSKIGTLGWRVDTQLGRVNPYASVQFHHQFGDTQYKMRSALNSTKASFVMDSSKQNKDWREYTIGANANLFGNIHGFASVTRNEGSSQDPNYNFSLGINARF